MDELENSVGPIFAGAFGFGIAFDTLTEKWWDMNNRGVRIYWYTWAQY